MALALELSRRLLGGRGAWRVHGGGFAGTIQAFVPDGLLDACLLYTSSPDVRFIHDRMPVLLGAGDVGAWLNAGEGGTWLSQHALSHVEYEKAQ